MSRVPALALGTLVAAAVAFLVLPVVGLVVNAPWDRLWSLVTSRPVLDALWLSLVTSVAATAVALLLGAPLAWVLARREFPGKRLLRALAVLPMVLPPVVGGVALLLTLGRRGLVGGPLFDATGVSIPFTTAAVVAAQAFVAMPFLVVTLESGLKLVDVRLEDVAATLGAGRWVAFRRVTLPIVAPSLGAGLALTWARALGEFGATITFAGNLPGRTRTLPLAVFLDLEREPEAAYLMSLLLLAVSLTVLVALRGRLWSRS